MSEQLTFGRYRFEPRTRRLWNDGRELKLTRKAADVLAQLLAHAGEPVTKDALFKSVWSSAVVSDDALTTCIQELRKALGDDARQPLYIETRHRTGYRFIAAISSERADQSAANADLSAIAVLPFNDLSPSQDQDHFCDGLAEELIDALSNVDGLRVAARSSAFQFRDGRTDIRDVGKRLGVGAVLDGSVRKAGNLLRITVQLADTTTGYQKWSQRFDRQVGDVFAIQAEIAEKVATTLRGGALSEREKRVLRRQHTAAETYDCYLRGRQALHRMRQPDLDNSCEIFERAIALDPEYAPAWAGLATTRAVLYEWWGARDEDLQHADRASRVALELGPDLADAHVARGLVLSQMRRYEEAEPRFEAAARINPNLFDAYYYYARTCFARGHIEKSAELFHKAAEVRPDDFQSMILMSQSLRMLGRDAAAKASNIEAVSRVERVVALNPMEGRALSLGAMALFFDGQVERAMQWTRRSLELYPDDLSALFNATCLYAKAGYKEEALDLIERAFKRGWGKRDWLEQDPDYDSLRDHPRFQQLFATLK
ncbi:MAG: winged helix-turn-helix domain-containing protein [Pseudomonadota bacterium]|nr:winged helix-turn-helix domain-containing protein [Pseudomonadota bacterium]